MDVEDWVLRDLGFKKKRIFPGQERAKIVAAVKKLNFESFAEYSENFERAL